ncbi:MAG: arsenite methyltransferase [Candidatus Zixiibacteriota bacterium]|nr:MAG: arsenite methyltransferase [candidate division Zixibacteria bacterium]
MGGSRPVKKPEKEIKQAVKEHYGKAISRKGCCCGPPPEEIADRVEDYLALASGYTPDELSVLPSGVTSFGCGNPVALMSVKEGDVVLDLGSGAGLDLILASKKVGDRGRVIGLDMTPEMVEACRKNLEKTGVANAEVRQGEMEDMPVGDGEVDWIISNCVINLSPDKEKVFAEAYRVLKPGGQMMISDIVSYNLPEDVRESVSAWVGCIAGAVEETDYLKMMREAGFDDVKIVEKRTYSCADLGDHSESECGCSCREGMEDDVPVKSYADKVASVKVYARKPL